MVEKIAKYTTSLIEQDRRPLPEEVFVAVSKAFEDAIVTAEEHGAFLPTTRAAVISKFSETFLQEKKSLLGSRKRVVPSTVGEFKAALFVAEEDVNGVLSSLTSALRKNPHPNNEIMLALMPNGEAAAQQAFAEAREMLDTLVPPSPKKIAEDLIKKMTKPTGSRPPGTGPSR